MVRAADKSYDGPKLEARVAEAWSESEAYERTREHRRGGPKWYFIDGPPYATGHIHMGTARNKVIKDAKLRFMSMRGFDVRDQPGFDMHGLPIEVKVEKDLGFSSKKDIEEFGIDRFVEQCRKFAMDHLDVMTEEFKGLGVWMDWPRPYRTLDNEYIEGAWWALSKAHERGLLFESERVLTWCWRCETPLANAEVEFEDRSDPSIFVKFPLREREGESIVIWTTTPWTLPANVAVAANPELTYARVRAWRDGESEVLYVVESQVDDLMAKWGFERWDVVETLPGTALEGWRYEHPFALEVPYHRSNASEWNNRIILGEHVLGDRTGLVHTATGHGVEDFEVGHKYGIPVFSPVGDDGRYTKVAGTFEGLQVKGAKSPEESADATLIKFLKSKKLLLSESMESHSYGHCWRCKQPIIYRATKQWFIEIGKIQDRMLSEVDRVTWTPEWAGSARQRDWVRNAKDWTISRQRYWGIPLPVWRCRSCNERTVVGSRRELAQLSPNYEENMDLHRPWVDDVKLACQCGGDMRRVQDVLDVWFDSAVASWGELGWPSRKDEYERWFPCDWICEGLDQTRGWFYSQLGAGVAAMDRIPYERVLMHGWVHDEAGRPFSKSLGNGYPPQDVVDKWGCDAMRLTVLGNAAPWEDLSMGIDTAQQANRALNILWNVHVFATQYMALDGFDPTRVTLESVREDLREEDRWLLSRLQDLTQRVTDALQSDHMHAAARAAERFFMEDLSRWYVRLVRDRTWTEHETGDKNAAYRTLYEALRTSALVLAPVTPYVSDAIYRDLGGEHPTVHMEDWPEVRADLRDEALEREMDVVRDLVEAASNARHKANMKLRWPVLKITVAGDATTREAVERLRPILLDQTNAKNLEFVGHEWEGLELTVEPVKSAIGPGFKQDAGKVMKALQSADARRLKAELDAHGEATLGGFTLKPEHVTFRSTLPEGVLGADFRGGHVYIDTTVTDEIRGEGYARDLVRRIQEQRKELGLEVDAAITTQIAAPSELTDLVLDHLETVGRETRSADVALTEVPDGELVKEWDLEEHKVVIGIAPVQAAAAASDDTTLQTAHPETEGPGVIAAFQALPGIGRQKAQALYDAGFRSLHDLGQASEEQLAAAKGIGPKLAQRIKAHAGGGEASGQAAPERGAPERGSSKGRRR